MANPFNIFRRNQRIMMGLLTIMAMVAFVFFGPWSSYLGASRRDASGDTVVETKFGKISNAELSGRVNMRHAVKMFISQMTQVRLKKDWASQLKVRIQDPKQIDALINFKFQTEGDSLINQAISNLMMTYSSSPEEDALMAMIFAKRAEEMGFIIGDDMVKGFVRHDLGRDLVTDQEIQQIITNLRHQFGGLNETIILDGMHTELLGRALISAYSRGFTDTRTIPPAQRLGYYSRREQKATADVAVIRVAEFTGEVGEPTETEVKSFYEKHKGIYPDPAISTPGFRVPRRCKFEWFSIPLTHYLEAAKKKVTEEEIAEYYDKHKDEFIRTDSVLDETSDEASKSDASPAAAAKPAEEKKTEAPKADAPAAEPAKPAAPATDAPKDNSSSRRDPAHKTFIRLVADEKPVAGESSAADETKSEKPSAEKESPAAEKPKLYKPLSEVRDTIILAVARPKAIAAQRDVEKGVREKLLDYFDAYNRWESDNSQKNGASKPEPPAIADITRDFNIKSFSTDKVRTQLEIQSSPLGKAFVEGPDGYVNRPFVQVAFATNAVLYRPYKAYTMDKDDADPTVILYWKTEQVEESIPELADIRQDVVDAYKMVKARELAVKKATELAEVAAKSDRPLDEAIKDVSPYRVEHIGPVSWLAGSDLPRDDAAPSVISTIEQVPLAGYEFMSKLFSLQPGEAGAAFNNPMTIAYVIKQISLTPSGDDLYASFAKKPLPEYFGVSKEDVNLLFMGWMQEQIRDAKVDWKRAPIIGARR